MSSENVRFTFIIPVPSINNYVRETITRILSLTRNDWETLVVTNDPQESPWLDDRIRTIPSGRVGPGQKRDIGVSYASGTYVVFLDDDSYPSHDFLNVLDRAFHRDVDAVGGPAITPDDDPYWAKVSGAVFLSKLTGGTPARYRPYGSTRETNDWPSVNLAVRREVFLQVGGFDCLFWPGEDTFFCDKLQRGNYRLVYEPSLIVWHHRRTSLKGHLKQVGAYGLHRGYFARHFPTSSRRWFYFLPSLWVLFVTFGIVLSLFLQNLSYFFLLGLVIYVCVISLGALLTTRFVGVRVGIGVVAYSALTHIWYGARFLQGFAMRKPLISKLR